MTDFSAIIRKGLQIADGLTSSLQTAVVYRAWIGSDGYGNNIYDTQETIYAVVEKSNALVRDSAGNEVIAGNVITIPRPIQPNGAAGRKEPIDPRDSFFLQDGGGGPIVSVDTVIDPSTDYGYYQLVYIGS